MGRRKKAEPSASSSADHEEDMKPKNLSFISLLQDEMSDYCTDVKVDTISRLIFVSTYTQSKVCVFNLDTKKFLYNIRTSTYAYYLAVDRSESNDHELPCIVCAIEEYNNHRVEKHALDTNSGRTVWTSDGIFKSPRGMYVHNGRKEVYACDRDNDKIRVLSSQTGALLNSFDCKGPTDAFIFDNMLLVTSKSTNNVLFLSLNDGSKIRSIGASTGLTKMNYPRGLIVDPFNRNIIVGDSDNHRIQIWSWSGDHIETFGSRGKGNGQFDTPFGLALDVLNGEIYVSDCYNYRVQVLKYNCTLSKNEERFKRLLLHTKELSYDITFKLLE